MQKVECGYCLNLVSSARKPKTLNCKHVLCINCLKFLRENQITHCPFDGKKDDRALEDISTYNKVVFGQGKVVICSMHNLPIQYFSKSQLQILCEKCKTLVKDPIRMSLSEISQYVNGQILKSHSTAKEINISLEKNIKSLRKLEVLNKKIKKTTKNREIVLQTQMSKSLEMKLLVLKQNNFPLIDGINHTSSFILDKQRDECAFNEGIIYYLIQREKFLIGQPIQKLLWFANNLTKCELTGQFLISMQDFCVQSLEKIIIHSVGVSLPFVIRGEIFIYSLELLHKINGSVVCRLEINKKYIQSGNEITIPIALNIEIQSETIYSLRISYQATSIYKNSHKENF